MLENTKGAITNIQSRETGNIEYTDTGQINVREYQRGNQKYTIQRHWQHKVHKTQDKYTSENTKGAIKNIQSRETDNIGYKRHRTNKL